MNNIIDLYAYQKRKKKYYMYENIITELEEKKQQEHNYSLQEVEEIAEQILLATPDYLGDSFTPIVKITENFAFKPYQTSMDPNKSGNILVGTKAQKTYGHNQIIIVNNSDDLYHQRFVVAHELAHYLFEYLGNCKYSDTGYEDAYYKNSHNSDEERRANRFAAAILMPKKLFITTYNHARKVHDNRTFVISYLSKFFQTTPDSIEKRINEVLNNG